MSSGENQDLVLDLLYNAAGDPTTWNQFLKQITRTLEASRAALVAIDPREKRYLVDARFGLSSDDIHLYTNYYGAIDPWYLAYKRSGLKGWIGRGTALCQSSEIEDGEFYNDYGITVDNRYIACIILDHGGGAITALTTMRGAHQVDFEESHIRFLKKLAPHLTRALRLHRTMLDLKGMVARTTDIVDAIDIGVLGLTFEGKVCFANKVAERILSEEASLLVRDGHLTARDSRSAEELDRLWRAASNLSIEAAAPAGCTIHCGNRSMHITMSAFRRSDPLFPGQMKIFVTITDATVQPHSRERLLAKLFGITPAEARVIMLLVAGMETKEIAAHTASTQNTIRFQLKSIYRKTGTRGQNQLVRLVSLLPELPNRCTVSE